MSYASGSRRAVGFSTSADWTTADERSFSGSYSHPPSYDEFSYYQEQEYDESRYSEYGYGQTNGFGRQDAAPTVYNELIRASSSDSLEYQYGPPYDVRNTGNMPLQSPYGNQQVKCRQLPCRTFISCGSCPYGDRCVFLHDAAVVSKPIYIRSKVRLGLQSNSNLSIESLTPCAHHAYRGSPRMTQRWTPSSGRRCPGPRSWGGSICATVSVSLCVVCCCSKCWVALKQNGEHSHMR